MNNLTPRQQEIVKLVNHMESVSISELRKLMDLSQATVYREVQDLTQAGVVKKVPGGIGRIEFSPNRCVQCGRENNARTPFMIELIDGEKMVACCAHCGLMALTKRNNVSTATITDFFYGTLLNASQACYVLNSSVSLCCRPSTITFSNQQDGEHFIKGFGGQLHDFAGAIQIIKETMAFTNVIQK